MELQGFLAQYCTKRGLKNPTFSGEGVARLTILPTLVLNFEESTDQQGFFAYASLGQIGEIEEKEALLEACSGNLFGNQTGKGSLGYMPSTQLLIYFEYFDKNYLELRTFEEDLELFCRYYVFWVGKLEAIQRRVYESLSLQEHLKGLKQQGKMKIFFA